jgi:hypothetical protein
MHDVVVYRSGLYSEFGESSWRPDLIVGRRASACITTGEEERLATT